MRDPKFNGGVMPRRDVLKTLGATAAMAALSKSDLFAQSINKSAAKGGRIDVHHHHVPPGINAGAGFGVGGGEGRGAAAGAGAPGAAGRGGVGANTFGRGWTPERTLEQMDKYDIAVAMLSMTQMGPVLYDNTEKGRKAVRTGNDYGAKLMAEHPKRFGLFTGVPLPDIDGVMKEIEYGFDTLKADGVGIYTNDNQGKWPGDPYFDPMWKELNRRNAIVYMHPLAPPCCTNLNDSVSTAMNEFDFDITRGCTSILANGVLHKYPNVKIIIPHSGGTMPMIAGRIKDRYPHDPIHEEYIPNGVIAELQKFYLDIAHASFPYPMAAMMKFALPDHILFGTDYPFEPIESTVNEIPGLGISSDVWRAIDRGNAEKLLPRFKV
jgi:predicted TIM-barrel fold metal-dependent hydrolase